MVLREFLFFFALALTTYDALQKAPPKISDVPQASPFFNEGSLVTDWYRGELSKAFSIIATHDVSFVMYYAPWDAECQHAKKEFDKAAQIMFKDVHFAAINCWNPGGECRLHHTNIDIWPIIIVHTNLWKTLIYSGPKDFVSMVKFLNQVIKPLIHLNSDENLIDLVTTCDAVVVGFTPLTNDSTAYSIFYNVAMKNLEYDPFRDICFGIVTSQKLAIDLGIPALPFVKFILWNNTLEYPIESGFNEENISNWILTHMYKHIYWISPPWQKSYKLRAFFNRGPVLLMFTPRNHFYERLPYYDLMREIAQEYNNCGDTRINTMIKLGKIQRQKYLEYEKIKNKICKREKTVPNKPLPKTTQQRSLNHNTVKNVWLNKTNCKKDTTDKQLFFVSLSEKSYTLSGLYESPEKTFGLDGYCFKDDGFCSPSDPKPFCEFMSSYDRYEKKLQNIAVFENIVESDTSMYDTVNDPRSSMNLLKRHMKEICTNIDLAHTIGPMNVPIKTNRIIKLDGFRCVSNDSLSFVVIDSLLNSHFAESLGININNKSDQTAVVILDNKHESQYLLQQPIGEYTLREFIYNFTSNLLPRDLRSGFGNSNHTHYYGSDKLFRNTFSNENNASGAIKIINQGCRNSNDYECIEELNTSTFNTFIMQKNKALLLALCSSGSGSCGGLLSLSLMSVARSLKGLRHQFEVARIDTSIHDLPWEFTVAKYPTLMFFPSGKKEDSKTFPENQRITVESVLAFVLAGFETPLRLHAQVLLCNQTLDDFKMRKCLENTRQSVVGSIGKMLKMWRQNHDSAVKNILLRRLQCLRAVAINLGALNTTKVPLNHPVYKLFNESIRMLSNIWRTTVNALTRRQKESISYDDL